MIMQVLISPEQKTRRFKKNTMKGSKETFQENREAEMAAPTAGVNSIMNELTPVTLTKSSAQDHAIRIANFVADGDMNALDVATKLSYISDVIERARELLRSDCVREAEKYGKGETPTINGAKIELAETGVKYDYSRCGDTAWENFNQQIVSAKESMKSREAFLKSLKSPMSIADELTGGEMITVHPPQKSSTTNIKITFAK